MGGDRHHPLIVAIAGGLANRGFAALRVDLTDPDVSTSAAALEFEAASLVAATKVERLVLIGYSWGSAVTLRARPAGLSARVLVAPPVSMLAATAVDLDTPTLALVPEHDQYGGPDAVNEAFADATATTIEVIDGADHFLGAAVPRIADRAVEWTTRH